MCRSVPQMPHAATATTTSRGPGVGSGIDSTVTRPTSITAAFMPFPGRVVSGNECGNTVIALEGFQRGPRAALVQRREVALVGRREPLVVDQIAEQLPVADERERIVALRLRGGVQRVGQPVDDLDRLAVLVDALGVARPRRHDRDRPLDLAVVLQVVADHRQQPLGDPVGALRAQPRDRVAHLRVGEPLDQLPLVGVQVDPRHRAQATAWPPGPCRRAGTRRTAGPGRRRAPAGSPRGSRGSTAPGGWR